MTTNKPLDMEIEKIIVEFANRVLDVKNGKDNPTLGEMIDVPKAAIQKLLIEARIDEVKNLSGWLYPKRQRERIKELQEGSSE